MVREEILDDGTRLYWLTLGPGMPEEQVSEDRYLGWVTFRARGASAIADPELRARCAAYERTLERENEPVYERLSA
jgi:hypothetical protein